MPGKETQALLMEKTTLIGPAAASTAAAGYVSSTAATRSVFVLRSSCLFWNAGGGGGGGEREEGGHTCMCRCRGRKVGGRPGGCEPSCRVEKEQSGGTGSGPLVAGWEAGGRAGRGVAGMFKCGVSSESQVQMDQRMDTGMEVMSVSSLNRRRSDWVTQR